MHSQHLIKNNQVDTIGYVSGTTDLKSNWFRINGHDDSTKPKIILRFHGQVIFFTLEIKQHDN